MREVGDRSRGGTTLNNLGELADDLGEQEQARSYYEQALAIFQEIGAVDSARVVRENLDALRASQATATSAPKSKQRRWRLLGGAARRDHRHATFRARFAMRHRYVA